LTQEGSVFVAIWIILLVLHHPGTDTPLIVFVKWYRCFYRRFKISDCF